MGQAKERKARLGAWYGKPIGPGHPDFVPPKKPEPVRPLLRFDMFDAFGKVIGAKIDRCRAYADRVEVEFVDGKRDSFWPVLGGESIDGKLEIGSVNFGDVELVRYTETGCVFLRSQPAREAAPMPKLTFVPSDEQRLREVPKANGIDGAAGRAPILRDRPYRHLAFAALFATSLIAGAPISSDPDPLKR
jgi:hypothetical protein